MTNNHLHYDKMIISAFMIFWAFFMPSAFAFELNETATLSNTHDPATLPSIADRVPLDPLIVDLPARGRLIGQPGGILRTLIGRSKDKRLINVWGYARLVSFNEKLDLVPDILRAIDNEGDHTYTLHLRKGHKWSDGTSFTAENFRYWWEDIANNTALMPSGLPSFMIIDGKAPTFEVLDETTVRYSWAAPNPKFLIELAKARPPFIYRPAHYLKQFHEKYGDPNIITKLAKANRVRSWAPLHNRKDDMYNGKNVDMPSLQPWILSSLGDDRQMVMIRNPFYYRIDTAGQQLPYIDKIVFSLSDNRLIATKTQAGETDLQAIGLSLADAAILKAGEKQHHYQVRLWPIAKGSYMALFPNLTTKDPVWRALFRDKRFRHALSMGINRAAINRALYFGLAKEANNTVLPLSPLYEDIFRDRWAQFDLKAANRLLDEIGLVKRDKHGIRLLPDGRSMEIIVETAGEKAEQIDVLELAGETLREVGIKIIPKPSQRDVLRNRALTGDLLIGVWQGFNNGIPTASIPPEELAPVRGEVFTWPAWGDHYESHGKSGKPVDYPPAAKLLKLYQKWLNVQSKDERTQIWKKMLHIRAEETFDIGLISSVSQPVVVSDLLRNVPKVGIYGWDPGAQFGIHRMDEFFFSTGK